MGLLRLWTFEKVGAIVIGKTRFRNYSGHKSRCSFFDYESGSMGF
jgi:hypothetical protein